MKTNSPIVHVLRAIFIVIFLSMTYVVVSTSFESNLFREWPTLAAIPWMAATLKDFYATTAILAVWVLYKERSPARGIGWTLLFVVFGSIASSAYVLIQLFTLPPGAGVEALFQKNRQERA